MEKKLVLETTLNEMKVIEKEMRMRQLDEVKDKLSYKIDWDKKMLVKLKKKKTKERVIYVFKHNNT